MRPPPERLPDEAIAAVFRSALEQPALLRADDTSIVFHDQSHVASRVAALVDSFPASTWHAVAIKANPLLKVLEPLVRLGMGFEAASLPELELGRRAGAPANRIVFDSPAKTHAELRHALALGCHVNADSLAELDRIAALLEGEGVATTSTIGVRVNPQVGTGSIAATSVAGKYSKFGIALTEHRSAIVDRFARHEWLTGLHLHIGSQGCSMPMLLEGIERVLDLANHIEARTARRVGIFDIGGGLPVSYRRDVIAPSMASYADAIGRRFGDLFSGRFQLITEFGRYVHANAGWVATRVETVKHDGDRKTAIVHVGADLFLRECYQPNDWHHEFMVFDAAGELKQGVDAVPYVVAGPLCFSGDRIADGVRLPAVEEGDFIVVRDTGAYTLSMWSRYNSRPMPRVVGYGGDGGKDGGLSFEILRERESVEQVLSGWS